MGAGNLTIDLDAVVQNWRALDHLSAASVETAGVVKADAYGLGLTPVARALAGAGVRSFFVALATEGAALRQALGDGPEIFVFSGYMADDRDMISGAGLVPLLNSPEQITAFTADLPQQSFGFQFDTGMNRLGMEPGELPVALAAIGQSGPRLIISHMACADDPDHPMNARQLAAMQAMTAPFGDVQYSLAATGGVLLGPDYHFDMTRPGIGLYGGEPFAKARPTVTLDLPVIQTRRVDTGETVGYANSWTAPRPSRIATVSAGYADGVLRALGGSDAVMYTGDQPCPIVGRVSMDLITVDVTELSDDPIQLSLLNTTQTVDGLARKAGTVGYEILTSLGARYNRIYRSAP